ncbi:MAG: glycosyltransferase family 4 protein [Gammaproteobacteria bacterium]
MTTFNPHHRDIQSVVFIGNYVPRHCGIATFTSDLVESLSAEEPDAGCWVVAMNDRLEGYRYPDKVRFSVNQNRLADYTSAAEFLNISRVDIVCVQHEYGIFGGPAGSHLLRLLGELRMPVVTTLHTVLKDPAREYRDVLLKLSELSDKLVVMSHKAVDLLKDIYGVPEEKIAYVPHGIPDTPFIDPNFYKDQFGVEGKKVLLTFGLLSPNKGIETMLQALPAVIDKHPDVAYIILGATHPHIVKSSGEDYRNSLQNLVSELEIDEHVIFLNRFVENDELCEFLGASDLYITPYLEEAQITSGTLAYAMGAGKAVISTPYWYAAEMLADGRGHLVPFRAPEAMAERINALLDNEVERNTIRKRAYMFSRNAVWKEVARRYLEIFTEVGQNRSRQPRPRQNYLQNIKSAIRFEIPELKLDHLKTLTDDTGIYQHAGYTIPHREHGYCTDDCSRALIVAAMAGKYRNSDGFNSESDDLEALCRKYISFLQHAFNSDNGRFRNFMSFDRRWLEVAGSEDAHGRALWSLGKAVSFLPNPGQLAMSTALFNKALKAAEAFQSPRAIAFSLIGIHAYLEKFSGDHRVGRAGEVLADRLMRMFVDHSAPDWPWVEPVLTYDNGKIAHALLLSGQSQGRAEMTEAGLRSLSWLLEIQTLNGHFVPIGCRGWYHRDGYKARFDQQPIEAHSMIDACIEAFRMTGDQAWINRATMCFNWFLGHNDLSLPLYDPKTGGCRDGLMADGINQNQGAESTLAWLLSLISLQKLHADEMLKPSASRAQLIGLNRP